jgi:hypothetical protein
VLSYVNASTTAGNATAPDSSNVGRSADFRTSRSGPPTGNGYLERQLGGRAKPRLNLRRTGAAVAAGGKAAGHEVSQQSNFEHAQYVGSYNTRDLGAARI